MENILTEYKFGWTGFWFFFNHSKDDLPLFSCLHQIIVSLYISAFSICFQDFFFILWFFIIWLWWAKPWFSSYLPCLGLIEILDCINVSFIRLGIYLLIIASSFSSALFSSLFWNSNQTHVRYFDIISQVPDVLFLLFVFSFLFWRLNNLYWSIYKFTDSFSVIPILLLSPFSEFDYRYFIFYFSLVLFNSLYFSTEILYFSFILSIFSLR